ncbi:MAG: GNAT family N-acetyltransferase [Nitrosopumilaceae archaeon]|nr:GNAT family N-acetyltransferase [Nitrosopumilaceae archaeon]NIX63269.1 GNAT family N-acetyltransferase [Nitrosopumilaceae archaeon]
MGYIVKDVDIHKEKHLLLNILKANRERPEFPYEQRFDWLYYDNPFGEARAWIIWDEAHDYPAGFTAVFPRKVLVNHKEYICWNCGDFSIEKKYRSLGIAVKLRKAAKECVDRGMVPFLYAHPNNRMVHVHL